MALLLAMIVAESDDDDDSEVSHYVLTAQQLTKRSTCRFLWKRLLGGDLQILSRSVAGTVQWSVARRYPAYAVWSNVCAQNNQTRPATHQSIGTENFILCASLQRWRMNVRITLGPSTSHSYFLDLLNPVPASLSAQVELAWLPSKVDASSLRNKFLSTAWTSSSDAEARHDSIWRHFVFSKPAQTFLCCRTIRGHLQLALEWEGDLTGNGGIKTVVDLVLLSKLVPHRVSVLRYRQFATPRKHVFDATSIGQRFVAMDV